MMVIAVLRQYPIDIATSCLGPGALFGEPIRSVPCPICQADALPHFAARGYGFSQRKTPLPGASWCGVLGKRRRWVGCESSRTPAAACHAIVPPAVVLGYRAGRRRRFLRGVAFPTQPSGDVATNCVIPTMALQCQRTTSQAIARSVPCPTTFSFSVSPHA